MTASTQIKKGYYYIVLYFKDTNGKNRTKWISTGLQEKGNKRRAEQRRLEILREYEQDETPLLSPTILFADFVLKWLELAEVTVRNNSYATYKINANAHVIPYFRDLGIALQDLKPAHLQQYFIHKVRGTDKKKGLSPNTVAKHRTVINGALNYALKQNLIKTNPMVNVSCPARKEYVPVFYSGEELKELIRLTDDSTIRAAIYLAATYGFRRCEVLALRWDSVDFQKRTITIGNAVVKVGTANEYRRVMKTKASRRTMPMTDDVALYLMDLKQRQNENKALCGAGYCDNDLVCKWDNGEPFKPDYVSHHFKKLIQRYKLKPIRFHDLRHSSASLLVNSGFTLKEIQEWMGHSNIASTNIYAHLGYQSKQQMASRVSEVLKLQGA